MIEKIKINNSVIDKVTYLKIIAISENSVYIPYLLNYLFDGTTFYRTVITKYKPFRRT